MNFDKLFVFDLANNHMADVEHGKKIITELAKVVNSYNEFNIFKYAIKFQYRQLDTFIHPNYKENFDFKYIKRFTETALSKEHYKELKDLAKYFGFLTMCTPFDNDSVDIIVEQDFDILKIASCSFTDWSLLERIVHPDLPIIISTAGAVTTDIDKVVSFLSNKNKEFCLMHCRAEYPTPDENLELNQIDFLKNRYPKIPIGYSTHENPDNIFPIQIAISKGAGVFERHVALKTEEYDINKYSSEPNQIGDWLASAYFAYEMCGLKNERYIPSKDEKSSLQGLKRGVFVNKDLKEGHKITEEDIFYAIPTIENQLVADDISKYISYIVKEVIRKNEPIFYHNVIANDSREKVLSIIQDIKYIINESGLALPDKVELELSHHYGIDKYRETGVAILTCINNDEYCKKLLIMLPNQQHPMHYHIKKHETFCVLYGELEVTTTFKEEQPESFLLESGAVLAVDREMSHKFSSYKGCIFEEVSTTQYPNDSVYDDKIIMDNYDDRKTKMTFYSDWLTQELK